MPRCLTDTFLESGITASRRRQRGLQCVMEGCIHQFMNTVRVSSVAFRSHTATSSNHLLNLCFFFQYRQTQLSRKTEMLTEVPPDTETAQLLSNNRAKIGGSVVCLCTATVKEHTLAVVGVCFFAEIAAQSVLDMLLIHSGCYHGYHRCYLIMSGLWSYG